MEHTRRRLASSALRTSSLSVRSGFHAEKARYDREVVFHAMVQLLQEDGLFRERGFGLANGSLEFCNILRANQNLPGAAERHGRSRHEQTARFFPAIDTERHPSFYTLMASSVGQAVQS
jgi:hypothetical protein